jgi:hypothetical protein
VAWGRLSAKADVAASTTDGNIVTGVTGRRIRVVAVGVSCGATASTVVFNTKPAGAGTAISPIFNNSISLPGLQQGNWFTTNPGEGLSASTGAGSTTGIIVVYELIAA